MDNGRLWADKEPSVDITCQYWQVALRCTPTIKLRASDQTP